MEREVQDQRRRLGEVDSLKRSVTEYENKIAILNAEIDRLKESSKQVGPVRDENARLRQENEQLRRDITNVETNIRNIYETKITNMKTEYDQHITSIINRGDPEADAKINNLVQEL